MKDRRIVSIAAVLVIACFAGKAAGQTADPRASATRIAPSSNTPSPAVKQKVAEEYGKLPLSFEANQGQTDSRVKFLSRGPGYQLSLLPDRAVMTIRERLAAKAEPEAKKFGVFHTSTELRKRESSQYETLSMALVGAARDAQVTGFEEMPGKSNYFIGNDPAKWRTGVANFAKVRYRSVYPGVDLIYHGSQQQLEYDFIVAPDADPKQIRLRLNGAKSVRLTPEGDLELATSGTPVRFRKPVLYQESGGKRRPVDGSFVLTAKNTVRFLIGAYDRTKPLVIDPVFLAYSTDLGGNTFDEGLGIAIDAANNAYITGSTMSTVFEGSTLPLNNCGTPTSPVPCEEAFVAKLSATNATAPSPTVLYVTVIGGTGFSQGTGIAVIPGVSNSNAYVTGTTTAADFPTSAGAPQTAFKGTEDAFVTVLNSTGSAVVFSTLYGGTGFTAPFAALSGHPIAVDGAENAYITGETSSSVDLPITSGALQPASGGGLFKSTDSATTWSHSDSGLTSFNSTSIVVDPQNPNIVYVSTLDAGVFRSADGGATWTAINGSGSGALGTVNISALAIDTATTGTAANIYAGTSIGLFKSVDAGATWAAMNNGLVAFSGSTTPADVRAIAIVPSVSTPTPTPAVLYVGGSSGVFQSVSGGATWTSLSGNFPSGSFPEISSLVLDPTTIGSPTATTVYAGCVTGGVFKTINSGASWTSASTGLLLPGTTTPLEVGSLAIDAKNPNTLYAISVNNFNNAGVFRTTDGATTWSPADGQGTTGLTDLNTTAIAVDPIAAGTPGVVYVGTVSSGVFVSTDGGATWKTLNNTLSNSIIGSPTNGVGPGQDLAVNPSPHPSTAATVYAASPVTRGFVAKFNPSLSGAPSLVNSTYLGGTSEDFTDGIAVDTSGSVYVTGATSSHNYPTTANAFQPTFPPNSVADAFVTKMNSAGSPVVYSTFLGDSSGPSEGTDIAIDGSGNAYVVGITTAPKFPTVNAFQTTFGGGDSGFVVKLNPNLAGAASVVYSSLLGGSFAAVGGVDNPSIAITEPGSIAVDANGNAFVTGFNNTLDFRTVNPIRASVPCGSEDPSDCLLSIFVAEVASPNATAPQASLVFSTLLGPIGRSIQQSSIALDAQGNAYVTGTDSSTEFPQVNALPPPTGGTSAFVTKIGSATVAPDLSVTLTHTPDPVTVGQNITFTATVTNNGTTTATGVTLYPTDVPSSTIGQGHDPFHLFKQFVSETTTQGTCDSSEFCQIGTLLGGQQVTVTLTVATLSGDEGAGQVVAVGVGGNESDANPANNVATDTVNVNGGVDLQLLGNTVPVPATAGGTITYTLFVTNKSGNPASNVTLTDTLPTGFTITGAAPQLPASQSCTVAGQVVTCLLGSLAAGVGTGAAITGAAPATAGTLTNNATVTADQTQTNPGNNVLQQITDVVAGTGANNPLNARFKGPYAIRFEGVLNGALVAFAGELNADGVGGINTAFWDVNAPNSATGASGVTTNQAFTGTYNVGNDNRMTFTIIPTLVTGGQGPAQTFSAALGVLDANNVANKIAFVEFDGSGQTGTGVMETQQQSIPVQVLGSGSFVYRQSGETSVNPANGSKNHFATAGQIVLTPTNTTGATATGTLSGTLDSDTAGMLSTNVSFTGTFTYVQSGTGVGRGTLTLTFVPVPGTPAVTLNYVFYVVNASEVYLISTDVRSATIPMSSGFALRQRVLNWSNAWFHGPAVFNIFGVTPAGATDVQLGVAIGDGAGNLTGFSDENNAGTLTLDNPFTNTYTVAQNGRTPITGGNHSPVLYLYDLNAGFLVGTDANASVGRAEQQAAGAFSNATFSGPFFIGTLAPAASGGISFISGEGSVNTTGAFTFTEDGNAGSSGLLLNDIVVTGTNAFAANGRSFDTDGSVAWAVTPTKSYSISAKSGKTNETIFFSETATKPSIGLTVTGPTTASVAAGGQLTLTYTVSNPSTISATGIALNVTQPSGFTFVSVTPSQGACNMFNCSLGSIAAGGTATVTFVLNAPSTTASTTTTASINETLVDPPVVNPNAANTFVSTTITVTASTVGSADMALTKTASPASVIQGGNLTFTLTATNNGPNAATNVTVTDDLPAGLTFVPSLSSASCSQPVGSTAVVCNVGSVAVGASTTANIVATATAAGTINNAAGVSADQTDPTPTNNAAGATATVVPSGTNTFEGFILTDANSPQVFEFNTNATSGVPAATFHAGTNPDGIAISPNGRLAFVGNVNANYVSVIDLTLNVEIARIRNVRALRNLALNADGSRLVVPSANTDELDIIDTSTFQVLNRVNLSTLLGDSPSNPQTGLGSVVVVSHFAYVNTGVTSRSPNTPVVVVDINAGTATLVPSANVGFPRVHGNTVAATPDGKFVAVARLTNNGTGNLLIINTATNTLAQNVSLASLPSGITITRNAADPNGIFGYIELFSATTGASTVNAIDFNPGSTTFGQLLSTGFVTLTDSVNAASIGITADGTRVIATSRAPGAAHNVNILDASKIRTGAAGAILNQFFVGTPASTVIDSIAVAPISQAALANAPTISTISIPGSTVTPPSASNAAAIPVQITGSGFTPGALVRVGTLDPIVSTGTATTINVTVPQFAAAQTADIIVTNPNSTSPVFGQQISAILPQSLVIQPSASFTPANEVAVTNTGDNAVAILNDSTKTVTQTAVSGGPIGMAISADGLRAYPLSFRQNVTDVVNLDSKLKETTIAFAGDTAFVGQVDAIVTAPNIQTGDPSEFVLTTSLNPTTGASDLRLVLIDSDPPSPTFNSIVRTQQAGSTDAGAFPGALGVKPAGTFAYGNDANNGDLAIFNLTSGTTTIIPAATIGDAAFQGHIEVTQDGNSLLLINPNGSLLVFDIGANPLSPAPLTTITGSTPTGLNAPMFSNFRVIGKNLFAFDGTQNLVEVFNFDRTVTPPNFTQITSFVVPGHPGIFSSGFAVTPDNNLLYLTLEEDDSMAVLSVPQLLANNPTSNPPLITTLRTGLLPSAIVISPGKALVAGLAITKTAAQANVTQGTTETYTMTVTNSGPSGSTGVTLTDVLPAGLTFVSATPSQGTCSGTTTVTCNLGQLANGASASVTLTTTATALGSITNTATVAENETNSTPANASASAAITVTNTSACSAPTISWTGLGGDGQWTTGKNWNTGVIPAATDVVCIDTPFAGTTVTLSNSAQSVNTLTAASSFVLSSVTAPASLTVANGSTFLNALTLNGAALNSGHLAINGSFTSTGTSSIGIPSAFVLANGGLTISGTLTIVGNRLVNSGAGILNSGSIVQLSGGAALDNASTLAINNASILTSTGSSVTNRAGATINVTGNASIAAPITNSGSVVANGALTLGGVFTQNAGATELFTGGSISNTSSLGISGGILQGTGVISGGVTVASGGIASPGFSSPGTISVGGLYTQAPTGVYNVFIGGLTAGTQYDQITGPTNGTAQLNGTLNVSLISGFVPVAGNSFTILTCSASASCLSGQFATTNFPALPNGLSWTITYNATSVVLSASSVGCATGTKQWTGAAGDNLWATAANWTGGTVPGSADNVCIGTNFASSTITIGILAAANQSITNLNTSANINVTTGPLTVSNTATFMNALNISGGTLTLNGSGAVKGATNISAGTLSGTGTVILNGVLTLTGGTITGTNGAGILDANSGMSIPSGQVLLNMGTLNVAGATTFGSTAGGAQLLLQNGATINNPAGSTWSLVNSNGTGSGILLNGTTTGTFNNAGTFQMTGGTANTVGVLFNNTGTVNANAGTLAFSGGGSCTTACAGPFNVASGATLNFGGGTFALSGNVTGAGTVNFSGATANLTGTYNIPGGTTVSGGTANFTGTLTTAGPLTISGGTANFSNTGGAVTTSTLNLSSGTLTGTSNVTVSGLLTWTGGTISGTGVFNANGGISIPPASVFLDGRTLNVSGTTTFANATAGSALFLQNGAVVNNLAGATWSLVNGAGNGIFTNAGAGTFNNAGTFQMTGGTANSVTVTFNNTGTVSVNTGTLSFSSSGVYTQTTGSTLLNGGSITAGATGLNINGGTLGGTGLITGNVAVTAAGLLSPGFSPGVITLNGGYTQTGSYLVEIAGLTAGTQYDQLNLTNSNVATLGGTLNVALLNGFTPAIGNSFTIVTCAATSPCINGTFATTNLPTLPAGLAWNLAYNSNSVVLSVVSATGVSITKTASVTTTHIGAGNFTYTITVTNNNPSSASSVNVADPLPTGVTFVSATTSQGACSGTTTVSCALGSLASGASATITITVTPTAIGAAVNTANVNFNGTGSNSASATVQILGTADLFLQNTAQPSPTVNAGSNLVYTLVVINNGPDQADNVVLTDTLPTGVTFVSAVPSSSPSQTGNCTNTATTVTCTYSRIVAASSVNAIVTVIPTGTSTTLVNIGNATATEFDPNTANNTATATVTVVPVADLALTKTASPSPASVGGTLTYTLTVTNNGPSPATGVTLTDAVPANATFVSATPSQGTCTTAVSCNLGTLANAGQATITILVRPTAVGTITNTASVAANETDPVPGNNTATVSTQIVASADLALSESVVSPVLLGANLTYTFTVTNNGPSPATSVLLTDTLPGGVTLVSATPSTDSGCNTAALPTVTCPLLSLASGATATVTVVVKPNAAGAFTNSGTVSATEADPNPANNSASATATVNPVADLSLAETAAPQTVNFGSNVTFSFTVTNGGPSPATGVTLTDALPAGFSVVSATPSQGTCTTAVSCNFGGLANGASATLSIVAKATAVGNFTNTANVSANETDPVPANNTASASVAVVPSADLAISASASPNPGAVGVNLTFTMTVTNNGPSPATNVAVTGTFTPPATQGVNFVSFTPSQGSCSGTSPFTCSLGSLSAGSTATVTVLLTPTAAGTFTNTDAVTATEPDPVSTNNTATVSVNVLSSPVVKLTPTSLNFASQPVGTPSTTESVTLTNTSTLLPLNNLSITASGDFAQTNNCGTSLAALSSCNILVTFTPTATGTRAGAIMIADNGVGSPQTISLTGIGINAPAITLSPGSLVFSSRLVGTSSPALTISMSNSGNATLNIMSIGITGTNAGDFSQTNTCGQTLAPSASCIVSVVFSPTGGGQRTAGVAITSDARGSVPVVTLSGTGLSPGLDLSTSLLIFDNQTVGTTSATQTVTLSNGGATAVAITSITASGDFAQTNTCGNSVAASSNCAIRVTFTPTTTGTRAGSISIASGSSSTPLTVNLTGTGVVVTLSLSPASLTFNAQTVGTSSQAQSILLTNTGGAALTITSITPSGDFLEADNCGTGLAAGAACSINVSFVPTTTGTRTGLITVTSNAQGSPQSAMLTGTGVSTGPAVSLACSTGSGSGTGSIVIARRGVASHSFAAAAAAPSCSSLTFPAQAVGTVSAAQNVLLTNVGNDTLKINSVAASGDFAAANGCPASLSAGSSCNIGITFAPTTTGTRAGSLVIMDNAGDTPQSINLTGTGTPSGPAINLSASALPFGNQMVQTTSSPQLVTVNNTGNATLTFTSIKASGDFAETDTCANGVAANSTCTISVTFTPTATGARAGAITISDNAPGSPQAVTLSGEGTDITISVPPGASTSATISAGQAATFPLSFAPSGGFNGPVTVTCNSSIPAGTCSSSPASFTLSAPVTVTTTVTTTAPSHSTVLRVPPLSPPTFAPLRVLAQILVLLVAFLMFLIAAVRRRTWVALTACLFLVAVMSGCAGGSGNPGIAGPTAGTPSGTYTVTVVVKTASGASRSMALTVAVQ